MLLLLHLGHDIFILRRKYNNIYKLIRANVTNMPLKILGRIKNISLAMDEVIETESTKNKNDAADKQYMHSLLMNFLLIHYGERSDTELFEYIYRR
jgi:hypothetical protein